MRLLEPALEQRYANTTSTTSYAILATGFDAGIAGQWRVLAFNVVLGATRAGAFEFTKPLTLDECSASYWV